PLAPAIRLRPDRYCLACLCAAASNCSPNIGCHRRGVDKVCGPFLLTADMWRRARAADRTVVDRFSYLDYLACSNDTACAAAVISAFVAAEAGDCDGDGQVTCRDFGVLTLAGPESCRDGGPRPGRTATAQLGSLDQCLADVAAMLQAPPPGPHC
ncbi:invertebrate-type lysozyme 3-like, partial [Pollicipes pollicipes]|uniref:invertebrate-type lysozyme 3-like n=1 Tax=Pollicipes pollicipes TaxID=41117 RepID=UPI0018854B9E